MSNTRGSVDVIKLIPYLLQLISPAERIIFLVDEESRDGKTVTFHNPGIISQSRDWMEQLKESFVALWFRVSTD